jgi:hypothetical protein
VYRRRLASRSATTNSTWSTTTRRTAIATRYANPAVESGGPCSS